MRVIAATNRILEAMVQGRQVPRGSLLPAQRDPAHDSPLRDRREDILPLSRHFLSDANNTFHKAVKRLAPETETMLLSYGWPGNVRELKNLIERLVILSTGETIEADQLPLPVSGEVESPLPEEVPREPRTLAAVEKAYILKVLRQVNGNKSEAAKILGITRQTLRKKLTEDPS